MCVGVGVSGCLLLAVFDFLFYLLGLVGEGCDKVESSHEVNRGFIYTPISFGFNDNLINYSASPLSNTLLWKSAFRIPNNRSVCVCTSPHITPNTDISRPQTGCTSNAERFVSAGLPKKNKNLLSRNS